MRRRTDICKTTAQLAWTWVLLLASSLWINAQNHPLESLDANELSTATAILRTDNKLKGGEMFPEISLHEPPKSEVLAWKPGQPFRREAFVSVFDLPANRVYEAIVDLRARRVVSWKHIPGAGPLLTAQENTMAIDITRTNSEWQASMSRRGITNLNDVALSVWSVGHVLLPKPKDARLVRVIPYYQRKQLNSFGPPIEGVEAIVDLSLGKIVRFTDTGVRPLPQSNTDYFDPAVRGTNRASLPPIQYVQPQGVSFKVSGNEIQWDRWRFRYGFNSREGLVVYQVRYLDEGRERSIIYRGSVSEMLVPYGDPDPGWAWRNAFDEGEYGLGKLAAPLVPTRNSPAHATLVSPVLADDSGIPVTFTNRVEIYETIGGGLWNHWEYAAHPEGRRMRELRVGFTATIGNYDYSFHWIFRPDASIEIRLELNGILLMKGARTTVCQICNPGSAKSASTSHPLEDKFGTLVAPNIIAPNHQHFANIRLDFDVDGIENTVKEINAVPMKRGRNNPFDNAIIAQPTIFNREREAARDVNVATHRTWAIYNPNVKTELGHFPAWWLIPHGNAFPFLSPRSPVRQTAPFIDHHFFATAYRASEQFAAGDYPTLSKKYVGLRDWVNDNEPIANRDLVVWYTVGVTHVPRPEDFPIMPSVSTGFSIIPKGFFNRSPALDVP